MPRDAPLSRRTVLKGGAATAAALTFGGLTSEAARAAVAGSRRGPAVPVRWEVAADKSFTRICAAGTSSPTSAVTTPSRSW